MIKNLLLITVLALRVFYQPATDQHTIAPFASPNPTISTRQVPPLPSPVASSPTAKVVEFNGSINNNKAILQWTVSDNENAAQFEVEKSTDGKKFSMAALVFGTDKMATDNYQFYEKTTNKKMVYRIKIINKNQTVDYSSIIEVKP